MIEIILTSLTVVVLATLFCMITSLQKRISPKNVSKETGRYKDGKVSGYYRKDGTYVKPYKRS